MNQAQSNQASILITSSNTSDAMMVKLLLENEFDQVFISTDPLNASADFDQYRPDVLILAFKSLEKSEQHYLELYRQGGSVLLHPHHTVILCGDNEVQRAYQLCCDGNFDDYILFWTVTGDPNRLHMSVHMALRKLAALAVPSTAQFVVQTQRLETLESLLKDQIAQSAMHVNSIGQTAAQASVSANEAFDAFSQRMVNGEMPDVVDVKNAEGLGQEMRHLKHEAIETTSDAVKKSVQPLNKWVNEFREASAPHLESIRTLNALADSFPQTVLVVDDDGFQRRLIDNALKGEHYRLLFAESGYQAMMLLRQLLPDLILMDVMMPEFGGLEVVRMIKKYDRLARVPVLMMTGNSEKDIVIKSRKVGACGFIVKPFSRDLLLTKVREALRSA